MMKFTLPIIVAAAIILSGCKATVETEVSLKDILEEKTKTINGDLYVEVAACNSYEDSRKPSSSVVKAKEAIPSIFDDAKYIECFTKQFKSLAHFSIPVVLDKDHDGKLASESHVNIVSNSESLISVGIPKSIKANMDRVKANNFSAGSFDIKVNIKVKNDTGKKLPLNVTAAYVDGKPYINGKITSKANDSFVVTLSDVSVSSALKGETAKVLSH